MCLGACFQRTVQENKGDKHLSCTDGEYSLFFFFFCASCACLVCHMFYYCVRTDAQQKLFVFLLSSEQRTYSPLFFPLFLCASLRRRFCFALLKKTGMHERMLFWAQAFSGYRRGDEVGKTCKDLTPFVFAEL